MKTSEEFEEDIKNDLVEVFIKHTAQMEKAGIDAGECSEVLLQSCITMMSAVVRTSFNASPLFFEQLVQDISERVNCISEVH
jgi:hypothetical protein